jgi:hypothetical protein
MKIFQTEGTKDSTDKTVEVELLFPEPVQYVALSGFLNDQHITYKFHFESVDGRAWHAVCTRANEGRWIPSIRVLGFQYP